MLDPNFWFELLIWGLSSFFLAWLAATVGCWISFGRFVPGDIHWTERARVAWPGARWAASTPLIVPALVAYIFGDTARQESGILWACVWVSALFGVLWASAKSLTRHCRPCTVRNLLVNLLIAFLFFAPSVTSGVIAAVFLTGRALDRVTFAIMAAALVLSIGSCSVARC